VGPEKHIGVPLLAAATIIQTTRETPRTGTTNDQKVRNVKKRWTEDQFLQAKRVLSRHVNVSNACRELDVTPDALQKLFQRENLPPPKTFLRGQVDVVAEDFQPLVDALKKSPTFDSLCSTLDLSPARARDLLSRARAAGYAVRVGAEVVGIGHDETSDVRDIEVPPTEGGRFKIGVVSDLHAGSKYCLRAQLRDCIERMYSRGVRDILIPGDLTDGCYKHGVFELKYSGIQDQIADLERMLPKKEGLRYHAISGNHDFTFSEKTGLDFGGVCEGYFRSRGRVDLRCYGDRAATLRVGGTTVRLLHPSGSCSYAISYKLQKFVEAFDSGEKPGILLVGHYHRSCYIYTRGVHAFAVPTFQGPGSAFGKSLGLGPQAIGGLILSWKLTKFHTIRSLQFEPLSYFKTEKEKETGAG
jgi:predicted phosphodiesterase